LHLEFPKNEAWIKANAILPEADVLVLAGDIVPFAVMEKYSWFFDDLAGKFKVVYWLPGNHEYYRSDAMLRSGSFKEAIRRNVFLLNNEAIELDDVTLICSTLWSSIGPANEWAISKSMSDFKVIRYGRERFRPIHAFRLHRTCRRFIEEAVATAKGKVVVATHHVPTFLNYPEQYRHSELNEAFATELYDYIDSSNIAAWIYGHHHSNTPDFMIGETAMLTAQLGYVEYGENVGFNPLSTLTV
jgi:predicted phosphohydrolase